MATLAPPQPPTSTSAIAPPSSPSSPSHETTKHRLHRTHTDETFFNLPSLSRSTPNLCRQNDATASPPATTSQPHDPHPTANLAPTAPDLNRSQSSPAVTTYSSEQTPEQTLLTRYIHAPVIALSFIISLFLTTHKHHHPEKDKDNVIRKKHRQMARLEFSQAWERREKVVWILVMGLGVLGGLVGGMVVWGARTALTSGLGTG